MDTYEEIRKQCSSFGIVTIEQIMKTIIELETDCINSIVDIQESYGMGLISGAEMIGQINSATGFQILKKAQIIDAVKDEYSEEFINGALLYYRR